MSNHEAVRSWLDAQELPANMNPTAAEIAELHNVDTFGTLEHVEVIVDHLSPPVQYMTLLEFGLMPIIRNLITKYFPKEQHTTALERVCLIHHGLNLDPISFVQVRLIASDPLMMVWTPFIQDLYAYLRVINWSPTHITGQIEMAPPSWTPATHESVITFPIMPTAFQYPDPAAPDHPHHAAHVQTFVGDIGPLLVRAVASRGLEHLEFVGVRFVPPHGDWTCSLVQVLAATNDPEEFWVPFARELDLASRQFGDGQIRVVPVVCPDDTGTVHSVDDLEMYDTN